MFFPQSVTPRDRFTIASDFRKRAHQATQAGDFREADRLWTLYDRAHTQLVATELAAAAKTR